jgi:hypothetical protein
VISQKALLKHELTSQIGFLAACRTTHVVTAMSLIGVCTRCQNASQCENLFTTSVAFMVCPQAGA